MVPRILGLDMLDQLGATVDTVAKQHLVSTNANTVHGTDSLASVCHRAY